MLVLHKNYLHLYGFYTIKIDERNRKWRDEGASPLWFYCFLNFFSSLALNLLLLNSLSNLSISLSDPVIDLFFS